MGNRYDMKTIDIAPVGVIYYLATPQPILDETYEPVSYEQWKMLRELEPSKFRLSYDDYVKSKKEQHESMIESRKNCSAELNNIYYSIDENDLEQTQNRIRGVKSDENFQKWIGGNDIEEIIEYILNL